MVMMKVLSCGSSEGVYRMILKYLSLMLLNTRGSFEKLHIGKGRCTFLLSKIFSL